MVPSHDVNGNAERILIVDDDLESLSDMSIVLGRFHEVRTCADPDSGLAQQRNSWPTLVLLNIELVDHDGLAVLRQLRERDPFLPVVVITSRRNDSLVGDALRIGAFHFYDRNHGPVVLIETVRAVLRYANMRKRCSYLEQRIDIGEGNGDSQVPGVSAASRGLATDLARAAETDQSVCLVGEFGTGKATAARRIHQMSRRSSGPFVFENLAAYPTGLLAQVLFGIDRGRSGPTSARRIGAFEAAAGGTLLLAGIGALSVEDQKRFLQVLQDRTVRPLGRDDRAPVVCDVRVMVATQRDLSGLVHSGSFAQVLHERLRELSISIPPLRERREDIVPLAEHFLVRYHVATGSLITGISHAARAYLVEQPWPGNVRQLELAIIAGMTRADGPTVDLEHLETSKLPVAPGGDPESLVPYHDARSEVLSRFKKEYIRRALHLAHGVVNRAARLAGLPPSSFRKMMRDVGLRGPKAR